MILLPHNLRSTDFPKIQFVSLIIETPDKTDFHFFDYLALFY